MKVLLVEDETPKGEKILEFLHSKFPTYSVSLRRSVRSAVDYLRTESPDLIILDMSLPTFDISSLESGGAPQGFGGLEVMRFMDRMEITTSVVVVTAYEAFEEGKKNWDLGKLRARLTSEHPITFKSLIYYNIVYGTWVHELSLALDALSGEND